METVESVMKVENSEFRHGFGASFRRVTPSTHVGRLSGPHFELGFSSFQQSLPNKDTADRM